MSQQEIRVAAPAGGRQHIRTILSFILIPLSGFATDVYLPSLPSMSEALKVDNAAAQLTLVFFLVSYGLSQLFVGSLLDSFGRYKLNLYALLVFGLSCFTIATTQDNDTQAEIGRAQHG
ncbi:MAG: MFS transporter [Sphingobacteriales bacterium]|nr:MAG: MFS transporter [Sphingobacteriales bacterium]